MAAIEKTTVVTSRGEPSDIVQRFLTTSSLCIFHTSGADARIRVRVSALNALRLKGRIYLQLPQCDQHGAATKGGSI